MSRSTETMILVGCLMLAFYAILFLTGCTTAGPGCADNPRNMQCMSADQLQRELNK